MSSTKVVHRFIRNANVDSHIYNRVANRFSPFTNTLVELEDAATQRKLTLIGTTNSSTTLSHRTRVLLQKLNPDAIYVQASPEWWNYAKHVEVDSQQLFSQVSKNFPQPPYKFENNFRGLLFRLRYAVWRYTFETVLRLPEGFSMLVPGLETYYALKHAQSKNVAKFFGGHTFDPTIVESLRSEPDLYPHTFLYRGFKSTMKICSSWTSQYDDFMNTLHVRGGQAFAESIDRSRINFLVGLFNKVAPKQKTILVDNRDERIFRELYALKNHKNIVAVVNQWHMEGVQTHWRRLTNTELPQQNLSPVADMDIDAIQEKMAVNEWLRDHYSEVTRSEPATWQDLNTNYHKQNFEYERTRHTHHDTHEDIPEPGQKSSHHH